MCLSRVRNTLHHLSSVCPNPFPGYCDVASRSRMYGKCVKYPTRRQPPVVCHQHRGISAKSRVTGDVCKRFTKAMPAPTSRRHAAMPPHDRTRAQCIGSGPRNSLQVCAVNVTTFLIYGCRVTATLLRGATFRRCICCSCGL